MKLTLENIKLKYPNDDRLILNQVNLEMQKGEFAVLLGPSGCGKTSLLKMIAGFITPSKGRVLIEGKAAKHKQAQCGLVFQQDALFDWLNLRQNIAFAPKMLGKSRSEIDAICEFWLEQTGLKPFEDYAIDALSGGMQQRASLARALAGDPELLLLDEPFGALDSLTREQMQRLLLDIWQKTTKTMLMVTHSIDEAMMLGQVIYILSKPPASVLTRIDPEFSLEARMDFGGIQQHPDYAKT
ncbi:MAG: ABC transporter ATP-binding protein, partial [Alphaproteobacteria bacterium]